MSSKPHFGHTKTGLAVHARTIDHHKGGFNKAVAVWLTNTVGTMATFWVFCVLALLSLPAVLSGFAVFGGVFPAWMIKASIIALIAWVAQTFIQLVLLPALMVGQNLQNQAADARSAKTFEDTEKVVDALDLRTQGGLSDVMRRLDQVADQVNEVHRHVTALAPQAGNFPPSAERVVPPATAPMARKPRSKPGGTT